MSDDIRMIKVSEREVDTILLALELLARNTTDTRGSNVDEIHELADDIRGQFYRNSDEWGWPEATDPMVGQTFTVAEDEFINAGIYARERLKKRRMTEHRRKAFGEFEVQTTTGDVESPFADSDPRTARLFNGTINIPLGNDPIDW